MKKSIRILSLLLVFMLVSISVPVSSARDFYDIYENGEEQRIIDNVLYQRYTAGDSWKIKREPEYKGSYYVVADFCVSPEEAAKKTEIKIVDEIDGIPVKKIKSQPYYPVEAPTIKKITISNNIVELGERIFRRFANLEKIKLSDNLKNIGESAFRGLEHLGGITIPAGVQEIGAFAFEECTALKKVVIKSDDVKIGRDAFFGCENLKEVVQSKNLKRLTIGYSAFEGCSKLKSFKFPDDLYISGHAFYGSGLTSVSLPAGVRMSGSTGCFAFCKNLKKVVFRNGKAKLEIPKGAFKGCTALETVVLPKSAKFVDICEHVFYDCKSLKTVENSGKIIEIGAGAFKNCKSLESIKFSSLIRVISKKTFQGCSKLKSVTFKNTKNIPGDNYSPRIKKSTEKFAKATFSGTPSNMKFFVKNATVAKKLKTALKGSGVKNARIYSISGKTLYYKNVK